LRNNSKPWAGICCKRAREEVHSGVKAETRDAKITGALEKRGIKVLRFRYRPPISQKRLKEILGEIQEALRRVA